MNNGFTKLDSNIVQSSIMFEDDFTFKVWIVILAACESDGIARLSPVFVSSITRKPIDEVMKSFEKLSSPDPLSRSENDSGIRIRRVDGGWEVINYKKYRSFTYSNSPDAVKKRKQRGHLGDMSPSVGTLSGHSASSSCISINSIKSEDCAEKHKDPRHKEFVDRFYNYYKKHRDVDYVFSPADFKHLSTFLKKNLAVSVDRLGSAVHNCNEDEFNSRNLSISYVLRNFSKLETLKPQKAKNEQNS